MNLGRVCGMVVGQLQLNGLLWGYFFFLCIKALRKVKWKSSCVNSFEI